MSYNLQNFYKSTLSLDWSIGTGNFYVAAKPTISTGWLVISPNNSTTREIIKYTSTGTDANGDYVVVSVRGVGGTSEQIHTIGEPIRMNITAEYWDAMNDDIAAIVAAGVVPANTTTMGGVEEATEAEFLAGTDTGGTGARLFTVPSVIRANTAKPADVQTFTASGTWTKPTGAKSVTAIVIGGGGSGASGEARAFSTQNLVRGGGGGGGGSILIKDFDASILTATVAITVGTQVAGGVGVSASGTNLVSGNDGVDGNASSFGAYVVANGGKKGVKNSGGGGNGGFAVGFGSSAANTSATAILGQGGNGGADATGISSEYGGGGGGDGAHQGGTTGQTGGSSVFGSGGGGGGGQSQTDGSNSTAGGIGGLSGTYTVGGGGAASAGNSSAASSTATAGARIVYCSSGGGGSGGSRAVTGPATGGAGGAGGTPGGGGGGSGGMAGSTGVSLTSGAGGIGARGEVIVITYF